MWRRRKDNLKRRMMSGILACLLVATSLTNTVGIITSFAGQTTNIPRVSYKYDDLKNDKGQLDKMVQINVQAENESFAPGSEMVLKVYVQNLSDQNLTGGSLKWSGKGLEEAGFLDEEEEDLFNGPGWDGEDNDSDTSDLMEELGNFSVTGLRKSVALKIDDTAAKDETEAPEQNVEIITDVETEEEEDDTSDPQTDEEGKRIRGIELAPGEVYETRFYGTVEDMDSIVTRKVTFEFLAGTDDNKVAQDKAEFTYNTGMALVLPIEFDDGPALMTNELNTMYIHTRFEDEKILDEYTWDITDEDEATPSDAERHEITVATMSNGTEDSSEGTTPANMKYSIVTYGAKLEGIEAWYDDERSGWGEMTTGVSFRVKDDTEPGVYFGQVTTSIRREGKSYKTTQGFHFFVLGDGQLVLKGNINGAEIQVKGDRSSFPEGDMLSLKVTEVPAEKMDLVQEAMVQKAEELGVSVDKMKAMDIKVIADGVEQELEGEVEVTFSNLTLEKVDETIGLEDEVDIEDGEVEELEEINTNAVFGLRKASAGTEEDQADAASEPEIAEAENESEGEEKEESALAVWHLDEDQGIMDEMDSKINNDGDVVMVTEHFSIYIVVNVNVADINVRFQHVAYLTQFETINDKVVEIYPEEKRAGIDSMTLKTVKRLTAIYSSEEMRLRNGVRVTAEMLSKIELANKSEAQKNYEIAEIWVKAGRINSNDPNVDGPKGDGPIKPSPDSSDEIKNADRQERQQWQIWEKTEEIDGNGNYLWKKQGANNNEVLLTSDSIVRFVYEEKYYEKSDFTQEVVFYDYDVTDGLEDGGKIQTVNKGINSNLPDAKNSALAVGQIGNKIYHNQGDTTVTYNNIVYNVNKANSPKIKYPKGIFGSEGIVEKELGIDGLPQFKVAEPGLFKETIGSTKLDGYSLEFEKTGDTYTMISVKHNEKGVVAEKLNQLTYIKGMWLSSADKAELKKLNIDENDMCIYSNNFWPLDTYRMDLAKEDKEKDRTTDPLMGGMTDYQVYAPDEEKYISLNFANDDKDITNGNNTKSIQNYNGNRGHNYFFGMTFELKFVLGDYVGPLEYYFRGDDDFWLYLDNELIIDLGGVHQATSESIDLWDILKRKGEENNKTKEHVLKVFYNERGATGSCCYMQFTLPHVTESKPPYIEHTSKSTKKVWNDNNDADGKRPGLDKTIEVELLQKNPVTGEEKVQNVKELSAANDWQCIWEHLPLYVYRIEEGQLVYEVDENGKKQEYIYEVREITRLPNYEDSYVQTGGTVDGEYFDHIITNTYHATTDVTVTKKWVNESKDNDGNPIMRPNNIEVQLWQDDVPYRDSNGNEVKIILPTELDKWLDDKWEYTWSGLPKYDPDGNEYEYSVQEIGGDWLKPDSNSSNGWYISEVNGTTITNTYIPEYTRRTVTKYWDDDYNKFGLRPQSIMLQLKRGWEEAAELNDYTVDIQDPKELEIGSNNSSTCSWEGLDKYYFVRDQDDKVVRKEYKYLPFEVSYDPDTQSYYRPIYSSENGTDLEIALTNKLQTARFRVAKRIDNINIELDESDLREDEFIVKVDSATNQAEGGFVFNTGLVLQHAGDSDELIGLNEENRVSGYIEVPVTEEGVLFDITEIVPKEYQLHVDYPEEFSDDEKSTYLTIIGNSITDNGETKKVASIEGESQVRIMPGSTDTIVIVHNFFDHSDYFHSKASVTNFFTKSSKSVPDMARLIVPMGAFMAEEDGKEWERKYEDDERLM